MWLVLCPANDIAALWAARGLAARGLQPLEVVTGDALAYNRRFEHRLSAGQTSVNITLADGRIIESARVRGTLNRLQMIPGEHLRAAKVTDRQYAEQELFALYLSWLYALPGVMLNRPTPYGLCGDWRHPSEWVWLANRAGLPTRQYRQSDLHTAVLPYFPTPPPARTIIVVNGNCFGPSAPAGVGAGCSRLAELSATGLLGVDFHLTPSGEWIFSNATPLPDLRAGGEALQDALVRALKP